MDVDHLVDLYQSWIRHRPNQVLVLLHGWEYSIAGLLILGLVFYHPIFLAAVLGHLGHVATDHFHNRLTPLGYFILYRAWVRFDARKIAPGRESAHSTIVSLRFSRFGVYGSRGTGGRLSPGLLTG